ncbi:Diaminopimelate epimerase-like protein [Aureobasidium subglaciale]|nr:Diaminopimelate epimerase-like protein [Aureobasidium subglaciale]
MPQISLSCLPIRANTPRFLFMAHLATVITLVLFIPLLTHSVLVSSASQSLARMTKSIADIRVSKFVMDKLRVRFFFSIEVFLRLLRLPTLIVMEFCANIQWTRISKWKWSGFETVLIGTWYTGRMALEWGRKASLYFKTLVNLSSSCYQTMMANQDAFWVQTEDWHTAGEPFRIVSDLPPHCTTTGATVWERRLDIVNQPDHPLDLLRQSLCHEPRGHADMYGGFIVPPNDSGAHFGVLFWHRDGFSTACGHGTIALGRYAVARGLVESVQDGTVKVIIDVPSGRVAAEVDFQAGKVVHVDFVNVLSYQYAKDLSLTIRKANSEELQLTVDLSWGGAGCASVDAREVGLAIEPANARQFIDMARLIKAEIGTRGDHAGTTLYTVSFFETLGNSEEAIEQKNVVVYADGAIDRSPCGSGTSARVAVLLAQGKLHGNKKLIHHSIISTTFEACIVSQQQDEGSEYPSCIPKVRGNAFLTGRHSFFIDPNDPTYPGFFFE